MDLSDLQHVTRDLPNDGLVMVLNTGAIITPEAEAMLQALHSRSLGGIREHLKTLVKKGSSGFMKTYYVGYSHKSIGDCGTGTIFIEGVSMLAAKAVQDWLLYSGQEASTRYIDFSTQPFIDPVGSSESRRVLEGWRTFYLTAQEPVRQHLFGLFPRNEGEEEEKYRKAINARAFDITRGFLPAGASTKLAWHSNLRQMADKLMLLRHHALAEVRHLADVLEDALREAYPNSFGHKRYEGTEQYNDFWMRTGYYYAGSVRQRRSPRAGVVEVVRDGISVDFLREEYGAYLAQERPPKTELPKQMAEAGTMTMEYFIDYGSFRDIQRHRAVIGRMPLLSGEFGFHPWYLQSLPSDVALALDQWADDLLPETRVLTPDPAVRQYYYPMGMLVPNRTTGDLPALVYLAERRAQTDVHPTLHEIALAKSDILLSRFGGLGLVLHVDRNMGRFDLKRGSQDIVCRD